MKKLSPEAVDVPQGVANRAVRIVEKHLRQGQVERARDLSEESRIRLFRDLRAFFDAESGGGRPASEKEKDRLWTRLLRKLEDFLSFGEWSPNVYVPLMFCPSATYCDGMRNSIVSTMRPESYQTYSGTKPGEEG
jgi:hypothetical protein